jgi:hypothetical protein
VEHGQLAEADERLRIRGDQVVVEVGEDLRGGVPPAERDDRVDLGIRERALEVARAVLRRAGDVAVPLVRMLGQPDAKALFLEPSDATLDPVFPQDRRIRASRSAVRRARRSRPRRR